MSALPKADLTVLLYPQVPSPYATAPLTLTALLIALTLAACQHTSGSCSLLTVREYDDAFTQRLVGEVRMTPQGSATRTYLQDQTALRDAVRACKGKS